MTLLDNLVFGLGRKLPLILQTEATECGLACLAMIAGYYGHHADLASLRQRFSVSLKGATLADLMCIAEQMELATRPLKVELEELTQLKMPCILHWNFNHFVVLREVSPQGATVHDPAFGERKLSLVELSKNVTGIALELWPNPAFQPQVQKQNIKLRSLMGRITGMGRPFIQILRLGMALEV